MCGIPVSREMQQSLPNALKMTDVKWIDNTDGIERFKYFQWSVDFIKQFEAQAHKVRLRAPLLLCRHGQTLYPFTKSIIRIYYCRQALLFYRHGFLAGYFIVPV